MVTPTGALLVTALVTSTAAVLPVLVAAGMAWLVILVHVNASMQLLLPGWVRARGLAIYQSIMDTNRLARRTNQERLRALKRDHDTRMTIFCSHDASEIAALRC